MAKTNYIYLVDTTENKKELTIFTKVYSSKGKAERSFIGVFDTAEYNFEWIDCGCLVTNENNDVMGWIYKKMIN